MINIGTSTINAVKLGTTNISAVYIGTTQIYPALNWFYLEDASGAANTVSIVKNDANAPTLTIETSTNGYTWTTLGSTSTTALNISVPANGKVYVRCNANVWCQRVNNVDAANKFSATGNFKVGGNVMSLLYGSSFTDNKTTFPSADERVLQNLFNGATTLTDAHNLILPATTLNTRCYQDMFNGCTALTAAPTLPATTLATSCYNLMFRGCTALTTAPTLPATTLADNCYNGMFYGCTALTTASELPATTLATGCYSSMYRSTAITTAPLLPAATLTNACYGYMFNGCSHLNSITCLATDITATDCTKQWVSGVAATGTFYKNAGTTWTTGTNGIPSGWTSSNYKSLFYFEDVSGTSTNTVSIVKTAATAPTITIQSSTDGQTWSTLGSTSTTALTAVIPANGRLYLRASATQWSDGTNYHTITASARHNIGGSIMNLFYGSSYTGSETAFPSGSTNSSQRLFNGDTQLVQASGLILPATTLTWYCYNNTFSGCTSLTAAPALPAATLQTNCYSQMFSGCTSLTTAPALPATTLAQHCYYGMFNGCTSLTQAPALPATTLANNCYYGMFKNCTSLTQAPELPATTLVYSCYYEMFRNCTSLTQAPVLPATTLAQKCYNGMFYGCSSLTSMQVAFTTWPSTTSTATTYQATYCWTHGLPSSGTFYKKSGLSTQKNASGNTTDGNTVANCTNAIPYNWTVTNY